MQSKLQSLIESKLNIIIGFPISYIVNYFLVIYYNEAINRKEHWPFIVIAVVLTIASIGRSYMVRRYFNNRLYTRNQNE